MKIVVIFPLKERSQQIINKEKKKGIRKRFLLLLTILSALLAMAAPLHVGLPLSISSIPHAICLLLAIPTASSTSTG